MSPRPLQLDSCKSPPSLSRTSEDLLQSSSSKSRMCLWDRRERSMEATKRQTRRSTLMSPRWDLPAAIFPLPSLVARQSLIHPWGKTGDEGMHGGARLAVFNYKTEKCQHKGLPPLGIRSVCPGRQQELRNETEEVRRGLIGLGGPRLGACCRRDRLRHGPAPGAGRASERGGEDDRGAACEQV